MSINNQQDHEPPPNQNTQNQQGGGNEQHQGVPPTAEPMEEDNDELDDEEFLFENLESGDEEMKALQVAAKEVFASIKAYFQDLGIPPLEPDAPDLPAADEEGGTVVTVMRSVANGYVILLELATQGAITVEDAIEHLSKIPDTVQHAREWPTSAISSPPGLLGISTYYGHPAQGRLRLVWCDPMPFVHGGIRCDVCNTNWIKCGYRAVADSDSDVDKSSYHDNRTGWDLCPNCALSYHANFMSHLAQTVNASVASAGSGSLFINPCISHEEYTLHLVQCSATDNGLAVEVELSQVIRFLCCFHIRRVGNFYRLLQCH